MAKVLQLPLRSSCRLSSWSTVVVCGRASQIPVVSWRQQPWPSRSRIRTVPPAKLTSPAVSSWLFCLERDPSTGGRGNEERILLLSGSPLSHSCSLLSGRWWKPSPWTSQLVPIWPHGTGCLAALAITFAFVFVAAVTFVLHELISNWNSRHPVSLI